MTMHTRAATDEIYDIFNAPLQVPKEQEESDDDEYMSDGDYTSGGESTCTTRQIAISEAGDDDDDDDDDVSDAKSVSEWSDFAAGKHIPNMDGEGAGEANDTSVSNLIDENGDEHSGRIDDGFGSRQADHRLSTPTEDDDPQTWTKFVPIPPEDYVPNSRPYRDPTEMANNRLPFMTPITERTEMSLGAITGAKMRYTTTPISSQHILEDDEDKEDDEEFGPISSPLREILGDDRSPVKIPQPNLSKPNFRSSTGAKAIPKGPIIKDSQCNPVESAIRDEILTNMHPPLSAYPGFYDHRDSRCNRGAEIRRFAKSNPRSSKNGNSDRSSIGSPVVLEFTDVKSTYTLKRELGAGAFAPVYLVENSCPDEDDSDSPSEMGKGTFSATHKRASQEALKMESPPTAWEFHMMRLAATRLGPHHRATASISAAQELHLYQDEGFLFLQYHPHGTLLDVVNFFREQPSQVMDEPLAMFFTVELLRTVEALHSHGILHGDLKADNCLLRLDALAGGDSTSLSPQWRADGSGGWDSRGVTLIDFGRGIDLRAFVPDVQFIADWKTSAADCAEMREGRPWTWQIDYHGLAGTIHCLLFGRYMETVRCDGGGLAASAAGGRRYRIRESLKRYWQTDLWSGLFDLLLNPGSRAVDEPRAMPVTADLAVVRTAMEAWLEANCEKGLGLRQLMGRVESFAAARTRK
jgi:checkpoint serine/threonine-protein kinase